MQTEPPKRWYPRALQRFGRGGLSTQLFVILAVFSLGPLFVSNLLGYLKTRSHLQGMAVNEVSDVASLEAARTLAFVEERRRLVSSIVADNQHLVRLVGSAAHNTERVGALVDHLAAKAAETPDVEELVVTVDQGRVVAATPGGAHGSDAERRPCIDWRGDAAAVAGLAYGAPEPGLWVAAPIRGPSGQRIGTLCGRYRFQIHADLRHAEHDRLGEGGLYLLDGTGQVICGSFDDISEGPHPHGEIAIPRPPGHALTPGEGAWRGFVGGGHDDGEHPVIAAYAPVPELGWGVLVTVPVEHALRRLERLKWQAAAVGTLLAGLLTMTILLTSRALTGRLRALSTAARVLADGALGAQVPTDGPREIADLAGAFNQMSAALHDAHNLLERRVADRTRALEHARAFTELLLDSVERWVLVVDREGRIVKANAEAYRRFGPELVGMRYAQALGGADPARACPIEQTFETGRPSSAEQPWTIDGAHEIVALETYPMHAGDGHVDTVVQIGRVVTEERAQQAQMVHNEKMAAFGMLAAGVAHDIGNPLASIKSQLRLTRDDGDPARARATLAVVEREVDRIARLIRELVDFSRRRRDAVILVSVNQVVEDVTHLLSHDPRARNVRVEMQLGQGLPGVRAREDDLVQVLLNLGINALDALPDGGHVRYTTAAVDGRVEVQVADDGAGIPAEVHDRVFLPFFTTKAAGRGTGLGLFVSRGIAERLGGALRLEATGPGGTVFALVLPAAGGGHGA